VEKYSFHIFDDTARLRAGKKIDPTRRFFSHSTRELLFSALFAATEGDLYEIQKIFASPEEIRITWIMIAAHASTLRLPEISPVWLIFC
jgi:hypothetical protein